MHVHNCKKGENGDDEKVQFFSILNYLSLSSEPINQIIKLNLRFEPKLNCNNRRFNVIYLKH